MAMLLLVSALTVVVILAVPSPAHHRPETSLNLIIDLAEKYNESVAKVRRLTSNITCYIPVTDKCLEPVISLCAVCYRNSLWRMCVLWWRPAVR